MFTKIDYDKFLLDNSNRTWHDVVRLSIESNISIKRMIDKMIKNEWLQELNKFEVEELVKHIDNKLKEGAI